MLTFFFLLVGITASLAAPGSLPVADDYSPVEADGYAPAIADDYSPVEADDYSPVEADDYSPVEADGYSPVEADDYPPVYADDVALGDRIVGGRNAAITEVPWQVSVQLRGFHRCGGTIISANWIVSAAHCFSNAASAYVVRAGTASRTTGGTLHQVTRYVNHPQYGRPTSVSNDITVMRVATAFRFTNSVRAARLPTQGQVVRGGTMSRISGWGALRSGVPTLPVILQLADVPIVDFAQCQRWNGANSVRQDMICAGFAQGGVDTCQGDSGGPLVISGQLIGTTSWGWGCAAAQRPGVYASIPFFRNWIRQQTGI